MDRDVVIEGLMAIFNSTVKATENHWVKLGAGVQEAITMAEEIDDLTKSSEVRKDLIEGLGKIFQTVVKTAEQTTAINETGDLARTLSTKIQYLISNH